MRAMEGAVPLSIFAEMPSGPDTLLVSRAFNRLNALDTSKASGPDGISAKMLKGTACTLHCRHPNRDIWWLGRALQ